MRPMTLTRSPAARGRQCLQVELPNPEGSGGNRRLRRGQVGQQLAAVRHQPAVLKDLLDLEPLGVPHHQQIGL